MIRFLLQAVFTDSKSFRARGEKDAAVTRQGGRVHRDFQRPIEVRWRGEMSVCSSNAMPLDLSHHQL
jgi:hypothetical protein